VHVTDHAADEVPESKTWKELKALFAFIVMVALVFVLYLVGHMMKLAFNVYLIVESFQGFEYYPYVLEDYMLLMSRNVRRFFVNINPDLSWVRFINKKNNINTWGF